MKGKMLLLLGIIVLGLGVVGTPGAWALSITSQEVVFEIGVVDSDTFRLTITNADDATGNWAPADSLGAFSLKNIGTPTIVSTDPTSSFSTLELNANGCTGGSTGFCFTFSPGVPLAQTMIFDINHTGALNLSTDSVLKVNFLQNGVQIGDLLSKNFTNGTSVPEPASLLLLGAGLAGIGLSQWKRRKAGQA